MIVLTSVVNKSTLWGCLNWTFIPETHNVNRVDHLFEVRVKLKAFDFFRFQLMSCTLHPHKGARHLEQLHPLQFTQTPEQHLGARTHTHTNTHTGVEIQSYDKRSFTRVTCQQQPVWDLNPESLQHRPNSIWNDVMFLILYEGQLLRVHTLRETRLRRTKDVQGLLPFQNCLPFYLKFSRLKWWFVNLLTRQQQSSFNNI